MLPCPLHWQQMLLVRLNASISIEKCPDDMYNKAFILAMDNGKQVITVIGKTPNPNQC